MIQIRKRLANVIFFALILQLASPIFADQAQKGTDAAGLAKKADRAIAYTIKMARESKDPKLSTENKDAEPFWQAIKKLNEAIDKIERGLFLKDETFFTSLAEATTAVEEAKITFGMSGAKDPKVKESIEKTDAAISLLRENYGKEAARLKKGGELTPDERKQLEELKNKQAELQRKLTEMEGKIGKNETLIKGLREVQERSRAVSSCRNDVSGFVFAMTASNIINGWIWGWHWWWGPWGTWCPGFTFGVYDVYVDVIHVVDYDWVIVDDYIDVYDYDLEVDLAEAEWEAMDDYIDDYDYGVTEEEYMDFSQDELQYEGEMDVVEYDDFQDYDVGDFEYDDAGFDEPYVEPYDEPSVEPMDFGDDY